MRNQGAPLGVVLVLAACSVVNKFEDVAPDAAGGESSGGMSGTSGSGGRGGNPTGGSSGSGTSGDGGAPPEGGTGGTAGDAGEGTTGGTMNTGGTGGCATMTTYYRDADEDTYGDDATTQDACEPPTGYVDRGGDCDDGDDARNPGATEFCNGLDENCNDPDEDGTCPVGCMPQIVAQRLHLLCRSTVNWTTARMTCEGERMVLARVRDSAESVAIRTAMSMTASVTEYWLGGTDGPTNAEEGTWRWLAGDTIFYPNTALYTNWALNEPAVAFATQDCLKVVMGTWYATECQLTAPFVCEAAP